MVQSWIRAESRVTPGVRVPALPGPPHTTTVFCFGREPSSDRFYIIYIWFDACLFKAVIISAGLCSTLHLDILLQPFSDQWKILLTYHTSTTYNIDWFLCSCTPSPLPLRQDVNPLPAKFKNSAWQMTLKVKAAASRMSFVSQRKDRNVR